MKSILLFLGVTLLTVACSSSEIKDQILTIYAEGATQIRKADSPKEINEISYNVAKQIVELSEGPDGETTLSSSEQAELQKAQQEFYQTVESRARQLTPNAPQSNGPILRP